MLASMVIATCWRVVQLLRRWLHLPRLASVLVFILFVAFVLFFATGLVAHGVPAVVPVDPATTQYDRRGPEAVA